MTRLEVLCRLHGNTGGTIHQYNRLYGVDFRAMSDAQWNAWLRTLEKIDIKDLRAAARRFF